MNIEISFGCLIRSILSDGMTTKINIIHSIFHLISLERNMLELMNSKEINIVDSNFIGLSSKSKKLVSI